MSISKINNTVTTLDIINKTNEVVNTVSDVDDMFIPANTRFSIKTDGTGDFTSLNDFELFLRGKYSNGIVYVDLNSETFTLNNQVKFLGTRYNIPVIEILGSGIDQTILVNSFSNTGYPTIAAEEQKIRMSNFTLKRIDNSQYTSADYRGIGSFFGSYVYCMNIKVQGFYYGVWSFTGGTSVIYDSSFNYCNHATAAEQGQVNLGWGSTISFNNCVNAMYVNGGGIITTAYGNVTYNNVTNRTNIAAKGGAIYGA